ncbi:hypothetical protein BU24DRAFT_461090 [Aaosphaeria arxii CBS 175.79]|uniref:Uncharacterized protein n=1 Tax=Aaosphaeria arxii CBS 175.79 TaxID=1450172 RepID=A0A6A5XZT5_9PLEO|nr:uncharacterized protein BU24DRAFT_461090 [Aaosphaeria arxii CBS 175.79]KAF2018120.1 hypothetical protein BU24DRAFT_461090 [Aaosphaeria arxii CBS 175.79]
MISLNSLSYFLIAFVGLRATVAAPSVGKHYPDVIPGPGLPSLEDLNLTSAELYTMPLSQLPNDEMSVMLTPGCGPGNAYTNVTGLIACFNYLNSLGGTRCVVGASGKTEFCHADSSRALGESVTGRSESSACSDVAFGLLWVIDHCTRPDQSCAGFQAPRGNGNINVTGVRR